MQALVSRTIDRVHETKVDAACPNERELADYVFGKLNAPEALEIQLHVEVSQCDFCAERVERMRAIKEAPLPTPDDLTKIQLPPALIARMLQVFEQYKDRQSN